MPREIEGDANAFFLEGEGGGGVNKVYHVQCENGELTCLLLTQGSNVSVQIHPTLLAAACNWCCLLFDDVDSIEFKRLGPFKWIKHHPPLLGHHFECVQIGPAILPHPPTIPCPKKIIIQHHCCPLFGKVCKEASLYMRFLSFLGLALYIFERIVLASKDMT